MAGFFGIGGKTKYVDEPSDFNGENEKEEAFFLEADEAKSLGNVEFMRQPKTIKRSFPKTRNSQGGTVIQQVSSVDKVKVNDNGITPLTPKTESVNQSESTNGSRSNEDNSLDMFREMAREIKK